MTLDWTRFDRGRLRRVLLAIYRNARSLKRFIQDNFEQSLDDLPDPTGASLEDWAEDLIEKARAEGWINDLYERFYTANQSNPQINQLLANNQLPPPSIAGELLALVSPGRVIEGSYPNTVVPARVKESELREDPRSAHLVVAVFWQKPSEQKLRVQPKLCYRSVETHEILQKPLVKDDCSIGLKEFPEFLKQLVDLTVSELSRLFPDLIHPWKLTVELFIPIDTLCYPLSKWCGQDGELLRSRSIVVGCSDRFDPDKPGRAADLHNQLKRGWQRFQEKVPDRVGSVLQNLGWLNSDIAHQENFEIYSGFRCYGEWLKPDVQFIENWQRLIRSGIPLALWMCEGQSQREAIEETFNRLIDSTRFEFLDRIPLIREEQLRTCNYCVGVFYEDPNYVPEVPRPREEQFFSWPGN